MAAKDKYHELVKEALVKEGWNITHDPFRFKTGEIEFKIDMGAEEIIGAVKDGAKIAVEIKSFLSPSAMTDFYEALGQFNSYLVGLEAYDPERELYLAVPKRIFETFFQKPGIQMITSRNSLKIIVYNISTKSIEKWIK